MCTLASSSRLCQATCMAAWQIQLQHAGRTHLRMFQDAHGELPSELCDFLQSSDARWDARLCAFFLYVHQQFRDTQGIWGLYMQSMPGVDELNLLCNYTSAEQTMLQLPWCDATLVISHL
jgi:hypothetical protein